MTVLVLTGLCDDAKDCVSTDVDEVPLFVAYVDSVLVFLDHIGSGDVDEGLVSGAVEDGTLLGTGQEAVEFAAPFGVCVMKTKPFRDVGVFLTGFDSTGLFVSVVDTMVWSSCGSVSVILEVAVDEFSRCAQVQVRRDHVEIGACRWVRVEVVPPPSTGVLIGISDLERELWPISVLVCALWPELDTESLRDDLREAVDSLRKPPVGENRADDLTAVVFES